MSDARDIASTSPSSPLTVSAVDEVATDIPGEDLTTLLRLSARGDEEAFAALYQATAARVYGLALRVLGSPAQADEVARGAYLHVWTSSTRFDPTRGSPISWILMIVHRCAVRRVRSAAARVPAQIRADRRVARAGNDSPQARRVRRACAALPPARFEAIELAYFEGFTQAEVAALSGLSPGTAGTHIRSGLHELRDLMTEE